MTKPSWPTNPVRPRKGTTKCPCSICSGSFAASAPTVPNARRAVGRERGAPAAGDVAERMWAASDGRRGRGLAHRRPVHAGVADGHVPRPADHHSALASFGPSGILPLTLKTDATMISDGLQPDF